MKKETKLSEKEIYEKFMWKHNTTDETRAIAATMMRYSNESWVDMHNDDLKAAIKLTIKNERMKCKK